VTRPSAYCHPVPATHILEDPCSPNVVIPRRLRIAQLRGQEDGCSLKADIRFRLVIVDTLLFGVVRRLTEILNGLDVLSIPLAYLQYSKAPTG
jgi:hypothetical protein